MRRNVLLEDDVRSGVDHCGLDSTDVAMATRHNIRLEINELDRTVMVSGIPQGIAPIHVQ